MSTIGVTDGVIMATIMTAHIVKTSRKCPLVQDTNAGDSMAGMSMPGIPAMGGDEDEPICALSQLT
jgi:hypothetical protein